MFLLQNQNKKKNLPHYPGEFYGLDPHAHPRRGCQVWKNCLVKALHWSAIEHEAARQLFAWDSPDLLQCGHSLSLEHLESGFFNFKINGTDQTYSRHFMCNMTFHRSYWNVHWFLFFFHFPTVFVWVSLFWPFMFVFDLLTTLMAW